MYISHSTPRASEGEKGSALIVSLFLIVITTLVLVGYATTSRNEVSNASAFLGGQNSQLYTDMALNHARALINKAVDDSAAPTGTRLRLATGPGEIIKLPDGSAAREVFPLVRPPVGASAQKDTSIGLNSVGLLSGVGNLVPSSNQQLPVTWTYVRANGSIETADDGLAYNKDNPLVGRYAFYTDDESARINLNTALSRNGNIKQTSSPTRIDLTGIPSVTTSESEEIFNYRSGQNLFSTPLASLAVLPAGNESGGGELSNAIIKNPDSFTHFSYSSILNMLGTEKIALTTKGSLSGGLRYLNILIDEATGDPGNLSNIDGEKLETLFKELYLKFSDNNWPIVKGKKLTDKYGAAGSAQIILNIIDYVRSLESQNDLIEPIHGTFQNGAFTFGGAIDPASLTADTLIGNSRRPLITGIGIQIPKDPEKESEDPNAADVYKAKVWVKVFYPGPHPSTAGETGATVDNIDIENLHLKIDLSALGLNETVDFDILEANLNSGTSDLDGGISKSKEVGPGEIRIIEREVIIKQSAQFTFPLPSPIQFNVRAVLSIKSGTAVNSIYDVVPLASGDTIPVSVEPGKTIENDNQSVSPNDPYVNRTPSDWAASALPFTNSPTSRTTIGSPSTTTPEQDTNATGAITNINVGMPRKGGSVTTAGLLGFVHTGIVGSTAGSSVPWRTIRLQPQKQPESADQIALPDWALVDLFTNAVDSTEVTGTKQNARAGLINLNTTLTPFTNAPTRHLPLKALLAGATGAPTADDDLEALAAGISEKKLTSKGSKGYDYTDATAGSPLYYYPGEIIEVSGIADGGEESEALIREILPLISTRSNVFRVYALGQSLHHRPTGILISSEKRSMSLIEVDDATPGSARAKVIYQQNWKQ